MPLTQEQIQQRRQMSAEARRDLDIFRIAESLEAIADTLSDIRDQQRVGGSNPLVK